MGYIYTPMPNFNDTLAKLPFEVGLWISNKRPRKLSWIRSMYVETTGFGNADGILKICFLGRTVLYYNPNSTEICSRSSFIKSHKVEHWFSLWFGAEQATNHYLNQLEQLERLRSEDTPRRLMITHTIGSQVKKIIDLELKTLQSRHDFQSQGQMTLKI